jgi:hypothetical protein
VDLSVRALLGAGVGELRDEFWLDVDVCGLVGRNIHGLRTFGLAGDRRWSGRRRDDLRLGLNPYRLRFWLDIRLGSIEAEQLLHNVQLEAENADSDTDSEANGSKRIQGH